jgi:hypothetical protein
MHTEPESEASAPKSLFDCLASRACLLYIIPSLLIVLLTKILQWAITFVTPVYRLSRSGSSLGSIGGNGG